MKKKKEEERDEVDTTTKKINTKLDQSFIKGIINIIHIFYGGLGFSPHQNPRSNEVDETYSQIHYDPRTTSKQNSYKKKCK